MSQADSPSVSFSCDDSIDSCVDEIAAAAAELENEDSGGASASLRKKAWSLCKNYLHGAWAEVDYQDIDVRQLSGGLSNWMYLCTLPRGSKVKGREPSSVLLRLFGQKLPGADTGGGGQFPGGNDEAFNEVFNAHITDNVIFTLLSERRLGPRLYGIFAGGRLEEYIESESLVDFRVCRTAYCSPIARIFANIHMLNVPIKKDGADFLRSTMSTWAEAVSKIDINNIPNRKNEDKLTREVMSYDFEAEINWLSQVLPQVNSPIVFCHNDLQGGNILRRLDPANKSGKPETEGNSLDDQLVAIDFEFCAYNYRSYDIANHWVEWIYDYGNKDYPYYYVDETKFPTREQKVKFLKSYVEEVSRNLGHGPTSDTARYLLPRGRGGKSATVDQMVEIILREVDLFLAVPDILWALWSIHRAVYSDIQFGYWHYAAARMESYFKKKEQIKKTLNLERSRSAGQAGISNDQDHEMSAKRSH